MTAITDVIDGDTLRTEEGKQRVAYIDAPESVHKTESRNTPKGDVSSDFAKDLLPENTDVTIHDYGNDAFGRNVSGVEREINGVKVDFGLVALDQQMASYYTKFGEHPDPTTHDQYKEYYSKHVPYQFGTAEDPLTQDELSRMSGLQQEFTDTYQKFKDGDATREEFDTATANLYGDKDMVMRYRHALSNWNRPIEQEDDTTIRGAMRLAIESDQAIREEYNRTVRNGHLMNEPVPERNPSFWSNLGTSISMMGSVSNLMDTATLWAVRGSDQQMEIPKEELLKGLPPMYHKEVLSEASKYGDQTAALYRDQLIDDIANNHQYDSMTLPAQLGYGLLTVVVDPLTWIPAAAIARAGTKVTTAVRGWTSHKGIRNTSLVGTYAAMGVVEGGVINAPRLSGDHTYTARDYYLDGVVNAGFGAGIGSAAEFVVKPVYQKYGKGLQASRAKELERIQEIAEAQGKPLPPETVEVEQVVESSNIARANSTARKVIAEATDTPFVPLAAISEVNPSGFKAASDTLSGVFDKNTPMRKLINSQIGLNKKNLSPEERVLANKLNADIIHIASAFPTGKVPVYVGHAIEAVAFRQKDFTRKDALRDIIEGTPTRNTYKDLSDYLHMLRGKEELWEGYKPVRKSTEDFFDDQRSWMTLQKNAAEDTAELTTKVPHELSYLKDLVTLNNVALRKGDKKIIALVEELNGMVSTRLEQLDAGDTRRYSDTSKSWGKSVKMSAPEIAAKLKSEGLKPRTDAYSARLKELRLVGMKKVTQDVNSLGKYNDRVIGDKAIDKFDDSSILDFQESDVVTRDFVRTGEEGGVDLLGKDTGEARTQLVIDDLQQDLLPRSYTVGKTKEAYKNPTVESLTRLRQRLNSTVTSKLGVKVLKGKKELKAKQKQLEAVRKALMSDKDKVINKMINVGQWANVEDVIRASATLHNEAKVNGVKVADGKIADNKVVVLTEENIAIVQENNTGTLEKVLSKQEFAGTKDTIVKSQALRVKQSADKWEGTLVDFVESGDKEAYQLAIGVNSAADYVGRMATKLTEDLATKFSNSKLTTLEYVGSRVTEMGRGYAGAMERQPTGGLLREAQFLESMMHITPQYRDAITQYATSKGKSAVGVLDAQWAAGADNKLVQEFNRDVFTTIEHNKRGRVQENANAAVTQFVTQWGKFMDLNHTRLVEAGIDGFTQNRKIANYVPHIWKPAQTDMLIKQHGKEKVIQVLAAGYKSAAGYRNKPISQQVAVEQAEKQVKWVSKMGDDPILNDQYVPGVDSRARQRQDIDTTIEIGGLRVMDFLDTEVISVGTKYASRVSGWVGLSKSTNGAITSQLDIDTLRGLIVQEGADAGVKTAKYEKYYDDLMNMMFGRPTRGGLAQELRQLKDLTALTRLGGLGSAQLIETGQVITRSTLALFSDDKVVKKLLAMANKTGEEAGLIREIQSVSNMTDDFEFLARQSVHLDQAELQKVHKMRQLSLWVADKATGGSLKATASRGLGKTSGYNMVRRFQSRLTQASFTMDVALHFTKGTGVMTNARRADVGITDVNGVNKPLEAVFKNIVEYDADGLPSKLNVDKWPKEVRDQFQLALLRDEAQQVQRVIIGELPPWMNSPLMALLMQFRTMPIVANNKQLQRSIAFADKEAVTGVLLNTAFAGLVRWSKFAGLGLGVAAITGSEWEEPDEGSMQADKYVTQFGVFPDMRDLVLDSYNVGSSGEDKDWERLSGQVPVLGLMKDYYDLGTKEGKEQMDAAQGLLPLGNTAYGDMVFTQLNETFGE